MSLSTVTSSSGESSAPLIQEKKQKATKKKATTPEQREKARIRKQNHRKREPLINKLNDLNARVRRICKKRFGNVIDAWVKGECERRLRKRNYNYLLIKPYTDKMQCFQQVDTPASGSSTPQSPTPRGWQDISTDEQEAVLGLLRFAGTFNNNSPLSAN
ncbi:hypothetical protein DSO57_1004091 [Entomophthora muscae]|uniref:Uncharacterized protein n=1 Tax=Entomophthora muscae TaxID=34485 RepID=A0ACC2SXB8_9FUNG|nr:hypothetical protein DSO57_1004091 [Entomophthora muscae]